MVPRSLLFLSLCSLPCSLFAKKPVENVLFLISDDLKASVLGCYGDKVCRTPNIDKLAAQSVVFERAYCQGTSCGPSRTSFMHSRYRDGGTKRVNMGQHFRENGFYSARVGKIYHMRVPGDIIAGTNGNDLASSWTERFNSQGQEAHTPGDYACLNLNLFTKELEGRQSTKMPHRMFVSVSYEGDGSDQPDHKTASKTIELLRKHKAKPFFLAAGFVRPHYPMVQPKQYFDPYPWQMMTLPKAIPDDLADMPKLALTRADRSSMGSTSIQTTRSGCGPPTMLRWPLWMNRWVAFLMNSIGSVCGKRPPSFSRATTAITSGNTLSGRKTTCMRKSSACP